MTMQRRYSGISTINHWFTALLVIAMLVLGLAADAAPGEPSEDYIIGIHIGLGFFVFLFIIWRVAFRLYEGFPPTSGHTPLERRTAFIVHRLLLLFLVLQVLTGPLYLFTEGEGMDVFGWFTVYIPLESLSFIHEPVEEIHEIVGAIVLPVLLILHVLGGIRHFMRDEQNTPADM